MKHRLAVSPCSNPTLPLDEVLLRYAELGYRKFEVFTGWAASSVDINQDPAQYLTLAHRHNFSFSSMHLPPVDENDIDTTLQRAIAATRFAKALGVSRVLFKASSRPTHIATAGRYLDAIDGLGVIPVLQNHNGTPISTVADFREVIESIDDPRMQTLLEVGQFVRAGERWEDGFELLSTKSTIGLVHFRDMKDGAEVPFGEGELDLLGLFKSLKAIGYDQEFVVEMEVDRADVEATIRWLGEARVYSERLLREAGYE